MNFESSAFTTPSGVTISGLISAEHRVALDEAAVELADDVGDLLLLARVLDAGAVDEAPCDPRLEALERVDVQAHERVGVVRGDLLDLDAALRREHEQRLLRAAVERDREVVLLRDVGGLSIQTFSTTWPRMSSPMMSLAFCSASAGVLGELEPPALPRPPVST